MYPKVLVLICYPLLLIGAGVAIWQTRRLAKKFPSKAWKRKASAMIFFAAMNAFGILLNILTVRTYTWLGTVYLVCLVLFTGQLVRFNHGLYQDEKALKDFARKYASAEHVLRKED